MLWHIECIQPPLSIASLFNIKYVRGKGLGGEGHTQNDLNAECHCLAGLVPCQGGVDLYYIPKMTLKEHWGCEVQHSKVRKCKTGCLLGVSCMDDWDCFWMLCLTRQRPRPAEIWKLNWKLSCIDVSGEPALCLMDCNGPTYSCWKIPLYSSPNSSQDWICRNIVSTVLSPE